MLDFKSLMTHARENVTACYNYFPTRKSLKLRMIFADHVNRVSTTQPIPLCDSTVAKAVA
ncbi:hypothetical protein ASTA108788_04600 [Asticcacaulis taihuensis]|uniref:Uncharacterized protein n=1 Tax=Asticcacaulis taihuensis TaxID=260084 RepID=A0A1G4PVV4_9CAUL|nr:hypothetical protein SAMN02927928_0698 [Asticcacaulis taihuensis]